VGWKSKLERVFGDVGGRSGGEGEVRVGGDSLFSRLGSRGDWGVGLVWGTVGLGLTNVRKGGGAVGERLWGEGVEGVERF
jgi:hypothetical protein